MSRRWGWGGSCGGFARGALVETELPAARGAVPEGGTVGPFGVGGAADFGEVCHEGESVGQIGDGEIMEGGVDGVGFALGEEVVTGVAATRTAELTKVGGEGRLHQRAVIAGLSAPEGLFEGGKEVGHVETGIGGVGCATAHRGMVRCSAPTIGQIQHLQFSPVQVSL